MAPSRVRSETRRSASVEAVARTPMSAAASSGNLRIRKISAQARDLSVPSSVPSSCFAIVSVDLAK